MRKTPILQDSGEIRPRRRNVLYALRRETNLKCLLLTILIIICTIAAFLFCQASNAGSKIQPSKCVEGSYCCNDGLTLIPAAFILTLYLLYLVECWHSKAREMISRRSKVDSDTVYWKVEMMRRARPSVWWRALCFHFTNRTQHVSRMKDGKVYTCWKNLRERVNTHQVTCSFFAEPCGWADISRDLVDLEKHAVTIVHFHKNFIFANKGAAREFQRQRDLFSQDLDGLDDCVEITEGLDLSGITFPKTVTCWNQPDDLPWFARVHYFWIFSLLLLSWPMRVILELNTAHVHYHVTKLFGTNRDPEAPEEPSPSSIPVNVEKCFWGSGLVLKETLKGDTSEKDPLLSEENSKLWDYAYSNHAHIWPEPFPTVERPLPRSVTLLLPETGYSTGDFSPLFKSWRFESEKDGGQFGDKFLEIVPSYSQALLYSTSVSVFRSSAQVHSSVSDCVKFSSNGCASMDQIASSDASHVRQLSSGQKSTPYRHIRSGSSTPSENFSGEVGGALTEVRVENNPPPDYVEALETSLPVWIPFFTRLRRCQTERHISRKFSNRRLQDVRPTFLRHFTSSNQRDIDPLLDQDLTPT